MTRRDYLHQELLIDKISTIIHDPVSDTYGFSLQLSACLSVMDIPFEIWLQIASYIPAVQIRNLYSVNRPFFRIAMDERYREVHFNEPHGILKNFETLK